jgi:hypothetical protein
MKKAHFQYIGYPRSGSTFLHRVFQHQPLLKDCTTSVAKEFYCDNQDTYKNTYFKFDYSINMNHVPLLRRQLEYLSMTDPLTDKFFVCLRNPYDAFSSSFALWNGLGHKLNHKTRFVEYVENLIFLQSAISKPFKIFYFDDLISSEYQYIKNICDFLEIDAPVVDFGSVLKHSSREVYHDMTNLGTDTKFIGMRPVLLRKESDTIPEYKFDDQEVEYFNQKITELEQYLDRDFAHWKR